MQRARINVALAFMIVTFVLAACGGGGAECNQDSGCIRIENGAQGTLDTHTLGVGDCDESACTIVVMNADGGDPTETRVSAGDTLTVGDATVEVVSANRVGVGIKP